MGVLLGIGALATAGVGAASAAGAFGSGGSPEQRNLLNELTQNMYAQQYLMPALLGSERIYRPQFQALGSQSLYDALMGTGGRTYQRQVTMNPDETLAFYNKKFGTNLKMSPEVYQNVLKLLGGKAPTRTVTETEPAQRGVLDTFKAAMPKINQISELARQNDMRQWKANLGARVNAYRDLDSTSMTLMDLLGGQAEEELANGGRLAGSELRKVQGDSRAAMASRGLAMSPNAAVDEILNTAAARRSRLQEGRRFAADVSQMRMAPLLDILRGTAGGNTMGTVGTFYDAGRSQAAAAGPSLFNIYSGYAGQLNGQNANQATQANFNDAAQRNSAIGGTLSGLGNLASAYLQYRGTQN